MKLAAAKARITIARRKETEYIEYQKQNNLFFDEQSDEELMKFRLKLQTGQKNYIALSEKIRNAVQAHRTACLSEENHIQSETQSFNLI